MNQSACGAKLTKFYNTPSGDTDALVQAIYEKGPISIAIDASHKSFSFYSHGLYYEPNCGELASILLHSIKSNVCLEYSTTVRVKVLGLSVHL